MPLRAFIVFNVHHYNQSELPTRSVLMPLRAFIVFNGGEMPRVGRCGRVLMPLRAFIVFNENAILSIIAGWSAES